MGQRFQSRPTKENKQKSGKTGNNDKKKIKRQQINKNLNKREVKKK
jgi:hypothetical protein